jgi:predicted RNA-binding Zn-ribbon protein involved in translation (DUF1610 family)
MQFRKTSRIDYIVIFTKNMEKHACPICGTSLSLYERYPRYVCPKCAEKTCDREGRRVEYRNLSFTGGCQGYYPDNGEVYPSDTCYIGNRACTAEEARFGGIVIQVKD